MRHYLTKEVDKYRYLKARYMFEKHIVSFDTTPGKYKNISKCRNFILKRKDQ